MATSCSVCQCFFLLALYLKKQAKAEVSNHSTSNTFFLQHLILSFAFLPQQKLQTTFFFFLDGTPNGILIVDLITLLKALHGSP